MKNKYMGIGFAFGVATNNIAGWLAIGIGFGMAIGGGLDKKKKK